MTTIITSDHTIHVKDRAVIIVGHVITTKIFLDPRDCEHELHWYRSAPYACPELIDHNGRHIVTQTWPTADTLRDNYPIKAIRTLLLGLQRHHIHHRDVHPANIVLTDDGPRLIDWECAINADAPSYDLHGPTESGIPVPPIHSTPMWWNSDDPGSIKSLWKPPRSTATRRNGMPKIYAPQPSSTG